MSVRAPVVMLVIVVMVAVLVMMAMAVAVAVAVAVAMVRVAVNESGMVMVADLKSDGAVPVGVGAPLWLEGGQDDRHLKAKPSHHVVEHTIDLIPDPAVTQLHLHVTIAKMVSDPRLVEPAHRDMRHSLRQRLDQIDGSIGAPEVVAPFEARSPFDEDPDLLAGDRVRALTHPLPVVERQANDPFGTGNRSYAFTEFSHSLVASEEEVALCERELPRRLTGEQDSISAHLIGLRVDLNIGERVIQNHRRLAQLANAADRESALF